MDYFLLKQDERYTNTPRLKDVFNNINLKNLNRPNAHKIEDVIIFNVDADDRCEYTDILDKQLFLISAKLVNIISKYDPEMILKDIPLIDLKRERQDMYYLPILEEVKALSDKSETGFNKTIYKKIVLDKEKIKGKKIFKIKESSETLIVVRLDVAESILRRKPRGVSLKRLEIE